MWNMLKKTIAVSTMIFISAVFVLTASPCQADVDTWTWTSGSSTRNQNGIYGTKGEPDAANIPGARYSSISWADDSGDLWLFGGLGYDSAGDLGRLNDLWRYSTDNSTWIWMSGSSTRNQNGVYGTKGEPDAANIPGARYDSISWTDDSGDLWLFGGGGYDNAGDIG